jgi:hypothetical protein
MFERPQTGTAGYPAVPVYMNPAPLIAVARVYCYAIASTVTCLVGEMASGPVRTVRAMRPAAHWR